jgi:molybdopterin converting factor subunit 1
MSEPIRVRVRLFAMQREQAGAREVTLALPTAATIEDAWTALVERYPVLGPGRSAVRFARNGEYAGSETVLTDGDEIACIPPVSGGDDGEADDDREAHDDGEAGDDRGVDDDRGAGDVPIDRRRILELREEPFDASILMDLAEHLATVEDGAVVGFIGRTRITAGSPAPGQETEAERFAGELVVSLEYEALEPMALSVLGRIADEIEARFGVTRIAIVHRTGEVPLGEASVAIVAVSPHREAAFSAARYAMDETKGRAPIWKAERFATGKVWIGEPARDRAPDE